MQTYLEQKGIETRRDTLVRNDYTKDDIYNENHEDALSDGGVKGKGTGKGGHVHTIPNHSKPSTIDYGKFDTNGGGGLYDIKGRNGVGGREFLTTISLYGPQNEYGAHMIDMSANLVDGQIMI